MQWYCRILQYFGIAKFQSIAKSITKSKSIAIFTVKHYNIARSNEKYESIAILSNYCKDYCKMFQIL